MQTFGEPLVDVPAVDRPGAYGVILNDEGQVAIVKTPSAYYLPGGGQDAGESLEQALERECLEEIGYAIEIQEKFGQANQYRWGDSKETYYLKIEHFFIAQLKDYIQAPVELDHELEWMSLASAQLMLSEQSQQWAIKTFAQSNT